jgi:transposase
METLRMNSLERGWLTEFSRVQEGLISVAEAARRQGRSERQARRLFGRFKKHGAAGLAHGLRGKRSNAGRHSQKQQVLELYRQKYSGFGASHACDMLLKHDKLKIPRQTMWRWLTASGLVARTRKVKKHRIRRVRRQCVGDLVQMDGSTHRWLGEDQPACVLFVMIDDATGRIGARFYESEDTASAFDLLGRYVKKNGLPRALYVDRDSIYRVNDQEARDKAKQAGKEPPLTQFGRAMQTLGIQIIAANSPQAKGRVERVNGTLQDRLVKELKLAGITTIARANHFLETRYLKAFNARFGVVPSSGINAHQKLPREVVLADVLCHQEQRSVGEDWCVGVQGRILQIDKKHAGLSLPGKKVVVLMPAGAELKLLYSGQTLSWKELSSRPVKLPTKAVAAPPKTPWKPGANHGWRRSFLTRSSR